MKFFFYGKDGGPESTVWGFWLVEIKSLFSLALLVFENGSRDAYHSHAFNCWNFVIKGRLEESRINRPDRVFTPRSGIFGIYRTDFHKVVSVGRTYVLTVRGPWAKTWKEYLPHSNELITLKNGREEVNRQKGRGWL